jgi:hypothetical protein
MLKKIVGDAHASESTRAAETFYGLRGYSLTERLARFSQIAGVSS